MKVKRLCTNQTLRETLGEAAYRTIESDWNAEAASRRLIELIQDLKLCGKSDRFHDGPCSKAEILKDGWYK